MKRTLTLLLALLTSTGPLSAQSAEPGMLYKLSFAPDASPPKWLVEIEVSGLNPEERDVAFVLQNWGEWHGIKDQYLLKRSGTPALLPQTESPSIFSFDLPEDWDGKLTFSYELALLKGGSETQSAHSLLPHISKGYSFGYSNNTIAELQVNGQSSGLPCTIDLDAPPAWEVVSGWSGMSSSPQSSRFQPEESALIAFGQEVISDWISVDEQDFECHQFGGGVDLTKQVLNVQTRLIPAFAEAWGEPLDKTSVVFFIKHAIGGTRLEHGVVVGFGPDRPERFINSPYTIQLMAHEFVHEWLGGKLLRQDSSLVWFGEGFTDYLSIYYTAKLDLVRKSWFVERMQEVAHEAIHNSSLGKLAFGDATVTWRDGGGPNETMAYKGSALLAFTMDMELRKQGHAGLMKLMQGLARRSAGSYTLSHIEAELRALGLGEFYERFIVKMEIPDLDTAFKAAGAKRRVVEGDATISWAYDEAGMRAFFE